MIALPLTAPAAAPRTFARDFSLEATRPTDDELRALSGILPHGTPLYLSSVPTQSYDELADAAQRVREAGFEPIPHLAARRMPSADALKKFLQRVHIDADVRRLLLIGGDVDAPAGPFKDALAIIRSGGLREAGIEEIGIAGYPDGHPHIPPEDISQALDAKLAQASVAGLRVHIVSQFSFDPERIVAWLQRLRGAGFRQPVRIGMAGPASVPALLRYAKRCGVAASMQGLMSGVATALLRQVGPDRIVDALGAAQGIGDASPHYFSFGGVIETARYARERAVDATGGRAKASPK